MDNRKENQMSWDDEFYQDALDKLNKVERDALYYGKWETNSQDISHILKLISPDPRIQHEANQFLLRKWPQLNSGTRISYTKQRNVFMQGFQPAQFNIMENMIRVIVSGWQKLRGTAMSPTLKRLDDPQERWKYSKRLWWAIIKSPSYLFWRVVGKVFKRDDWYQRGTELAPNPTVKINTFRREIQLEDFGWRTRYSRYTRRPGEPEETTSYFTCGYDVETDTLWVRA